jgi:hypothetical protein
MCNADWLSICKRPMQSGLPKQRGGSVLDHDGASVICSSRDAARPRLRAIAAPRAPGAAGAGNGFGYVGVHHHIGPGIRYIISASSHSQREARRRSIKQAIIFSETGNLAHTAQNKTNLPARVLIVEIVPKDWTAPALILPKSQ